jgi:hypothetical protein
MNDGLIYSNDYKVLESDAVKRCLGTMTVRNRD